MALLLSALAGCKIKDREPEKSGHAAKHDLRIDSNIIAAAQPVTIRISSGIPVIQPDSGMKVFSVTIRGTVTYDTRNETSISSRVNGRIEKLYVKYNFQPVKKGQRILEIYAPELAAAQRELLYISQSGNAGDLLQRARQRLLLLGMLPGQIDQLIRTGNVLYRVPVYSNADGYILEKQAAAIAGIPTIRSLNVSGADEMNQMNGSAAETSNSDGTAKITAPPVMLREGQYISAGQSLYTIYQEKDLVAAFALRPEQAAHIKNGSKLLIRAEGQPEKLIPGFIGLIQPVVNSGENFTLARVYLRNSGLLPGQIVSATIPLVHPSGWWIPQKAVWRSGNNSIVFRKEKTAFVPQTVRTGIEAEGWVQVLTPIGDWLLAENAWYLVDSESFLSTDSQKKQ
ncbi:putative RND-type efflux pump membrane fusion protein [Flavihumibacter petaseus NBRC 106054]|uniref:Putative RND-type efflux pump membrane fusion protein n=2 Tax=Flavihumibacter TaxID=1004301 RepID=A0A0E9N6P8_9BACT|nr:putative RND-type efflux pump membrane fusion protein [Flavihumibacter petaseus NBRC 106054]